MAVISSQRGEIVALREETAAFVELPAVKTYFIISLFPYICKCYNRLIV